MKNLYIVIKKAVSIFYKIRDLGVRINIESGGVFVDEGVEEENNDFVMVVRVPFQPPLILDLNCDNWADGLSTNVIRAIIAKERLHFEYADPDNIPPFFRGGVLDIFEEEVLRRENQASKENGELEKAVKTGRVKIFRKR